MTDRVSSVCAFSPVPLPSTGVKVASALAASLLTCEQRSWLFVFLWLEGHVQFWVTARRLEREAG